MSNKIRLENGMLSAEIRLPGSEPESERFDSSCVVEQVVLHGKHRFCQPEQLLPDRVTCYGFGLCAEYDMNDIGREASRGELFPKPGVGLLTQIEDGKPYDMWSHYEIQRYRKTWQYGADWYSCTEEPQECRGIALEIKRNLQLKENRILLETEIRNKGKRRAVFSEYHHNFVSLDDLRAGEGYCLEIPFDGTIADLPKSFRRRSTFEPIPESSVRVEGQRIIWTDDMEDDRTYHKTTREENILSCPEYRWTLKHRDSAASVSETTGFRPWRIVLWGIEHCICTEVYHKIDLEPGAVDRYIRTWQFDDEETGVKKA